MATTLLEEKFHKSDVDIAIIQDPYRNHNFINETITHNYNVQTKTSIWHKRHIKAKTLIEYTDTNYTTIMVEAEKEKLILYNIRRTRWNLKR